MRIGFIGLGNMGAPMAANLVKAGHFVTGYDLAPAALARLTASGGGTAPDVATAVASAELVFTMLPAGAEMRAVYEGPGGILGAALPSALLVDCSTIDVATARAVAGTASARGFDLLDAPVSGGVGGAAAAGLTFMVGGSAAALERARPALAVMGRTIVHAGAAGSGQAAKLCNNLMLGISMIGVCEAFGLADRLGLDAATLHEIAAASSGQCWSLTSYCPVPGPVPAAPSNRHYEPGFTAAMMLKDLTLAGAAAAETGAATPLGAAAAALYRMLAAAGLGGKDFSVMYRYLRGSS